MVNAERLFELDRTLTEIEQAGGQVWVEAGWKNRRVLLCHRIESGGKLSQVVVLLPGESMPATVRQLAEILKRHWDGEIVSTGTWGGFDHRDGKTITSFFYVVDPGEGKRRDEGVGNMHGIVRHYGDNNGQPILTNPTIVGANVMNFG